jgi:hypothetical protein
MVQLYLRYAEARPLRIYHQWLSVSPILIVKGNNMDMKYAAPAFGLVLLVAAGPAFAQEAKPLVAKSGETVDLMPVYGASRCRSNLIAPPELEVLQAPADLKLSVREEMVTPRNCHEKIKGGQIVVTVGEVKQPVEGKLAFRVKYKAKNGTHQTSHLYNVSLLPK